MSNHKPSLITTLLNNAAPRAGREKPFVSVVTPTWNRGAFLPYLLYMFRYQDYPADRRELIILDDSENSHLAIINTLTHQDPERFNIRYIHHPERLALGKKRNMLNELARGEYIVCMDDDDFYPADKLSYTVEMMQRHGALISGSDQIPIWYSHINRIFKTHAFGEQHILNGTFAWHRNYLKKHRYDDTCNLGEEQAFTDNFTVRPLQLPCERTILCISHSHNTFDKDFILGSNQPVAQTLEAVVSDPLLLAWYQSLHNATASQPVQWQQVDKIVVINRDARPDRWQQMQQELAALQVPVEKIVRVAACEDDTPALGRTRSHQRVLQMAQDQGWENMLVLEDDAVLLKQEKHVSGFNALLAGLAHIAWEVVLLGAQVRHGQPMKSLPGIIRAGDSEKVCAYLVNRPYYPALLARLREDPSIELEARWQPLQARGKWLSFYPCISYQRPGFSDIEQQETDHIRFYFNKVGTNHVAEKRKAQQPPLANRLEKTIGFFMETAFHYQLYQPMITPLLEAGYRCDLLISDQVPDALLEEMCQLLATLDEPRLSGSRLSEAKNRQQQYACLVSPYYTPMLNSLAKVQVRAMYGLAKESWNHAWWNAFYHTILCFSHHSQQALDIGGSATVVGNPRFDKWHRGEVDVAGLESLRLDARKPTLLYAPTFGALSSIPHWAAALSRLSREYNLVVKLHHGTQHHAEEAPMLALLEHHFKKRVTRHDLTLPLLQCADYVLTDNSGFVFDAIHAGKRVILLDWEGMDELLIQDATYSNPHSAEQQIRSLLPTARDMAQLRQRLSAQDDWSTRDAALAEVRHHYCDPFQDGLAGQRAAECLMAAVDTPADPHANSLLHSLQKKLF
ncbi:glycosyltransferase [Enterobacter sp. ENT03]|uniref:glycosyltransferase n=1 Tax=Enterobacter sp. ENT03 TaxID=2854780 RepID=UPI001C484EA2|nr:glycosyltransferase [Enterobacter sp. ENT03]MBV7403916.1 glycosyltransferase [Enterobacter sp. ENT03]